MLETLDAEAVRRWCAGGLAALRRHQGEIDDLNVYPVPDGDTGTNLFLTFESAREACSPPSPPVTCARRSPASPGGRCSAPAATPA